MTPPKSKRLHASDIRLWQWLRETFGYRLQRHETKQWLNAHLGTTPSPEEQRITRALVAKLDAKRGSP